MGWVSHACALPVSPSGMTRWMIERPAGGRTVVTDRLQALDVSFLYLEGPTTPMHVGGLAVFSPPADGFDYEKFADLVEHRIALVPRYRQKIKAVPGHLANPVWVDDNEFDLGYHVRRSALPRPGSDEQLRELVARVQSRPLDRNRPLWEMYLVEGLADGRFAVIQKTHYALVDGVNAVDIGQVILDSTPTPRELPEDLWMPEPEPPAAELFVEAVGELIRRPTAVVDTVRIGLADARSVATRLTSAVGGALSAARPTPRSMPRLVLSAGSPSPVSNWRTIARYVSRLVAPSTMWCLPPWPERSGAGCCLAVSPSRRPAPYGRWFRSACGVRVSLASPATGCRPTWSICRWVSLIRSCGSARSVTR